MIYGKQYHPQAQQPKILTSSSPPSETVLRGLLEAGEDMIPSVQQLIDKHKLPYTIKESKNELGTPLWLLESKLTQGEQYLAKFITLDPDTIQMKEDCVKMAKYPYEVLIEGETGTGKELIAYSMIGDRKGRIVSINCAGLPSELIESELFGYVPGAFTGGLSRGAEGLFKQGQNGVVFLDEINSLPMMVQGKLLRTLQSKTVRRVGGKEEEEISAKFVCASNTSLKAEVEAGRFRKDLYARISTLMVHIKPLRERKCDILAITESLTGGKAFLEKFGDVVETLDMSLNVRSLQQYVRRFEVLGRPSIDI